MKMRNPSHLFVHEGWADRCGAAHPRSRLLEDSFPVGCASKKLCEILVDGHLGLGQTASTSLRLGADLIELARGGRSAAQSLNSVTKGLSGRRSTRIDHDDTIDYVMSPAFLAVPECFL